MNDRKYTTADSLTLLGLLVIVLFLAYQRDGLSKQLEAERKDSYALRVQILRGLGEVSSQSTTNH